MTLRRYRSERATKFVRDVCRGGGRAQGLGAGRRFADALGLLGLSFAFVTATFTGASAAKAAPLEYVPGEVIVKLKGTSKNVNARAFIGKAIAEKSMTLRGSFSRINIHHFALKAGQSVDAALDDLRNDPSVAYAEPNYIYHRQSTGVEGQAQSMDAVREASASGDYTTFSQTSAPIQLPQAWSAESNGKAPTIVAVIDTGIDPTHPVFTDSGAVWTNPREIPANGIDDDNNGYIDDVHGWNFVANTNSPFDDDGHGTHVSGIVLGTTQDISASPMAAAKIRIMPLKFLDANGAGSTADAVRAIYYAVNNGAQVLSNSWGGGGYSDSLLDAMAYAYEHHVVFVAAAGNANNNNDASATYPANYNVPNVISVAATSDVDSLAGFSNYGAQTVHMGSPGVSIYSTFPGNLYGRASGTSMATPFVAGLAALMVRELPGMNGYQVKNLIFNSSVGVGSLVGKTLTQARLNVYNGVAAAKTTTASSAQPAYSTSSMRAPSSAADSGAAAAGCGLVKALSGGRGGGSSSGSGSGSGRGSGQMQRDSGSPGDKAGDEGAEASGEEGFETPAPLSNTMFFTLIVLLSSPVVVSLVLRTRATGKNQRRHTRYQINSEVRLKFGDREMVGKVSTISLGGVQLNTEEWLDKGGVVAMSIRSPDGRDEIQVEGKIVWSEENNRYGVAFANANESALSMIGRWTQSLLKA